MIRVGVIGCGKIAQVRHIPEYAENPNVKLVGFYDFNQERAQELADQFGGKAFSSSEELLSDPEIDAVSVCTANNAHAEISIQALEHGKHVLCEKPMAMDLADCEAMVEAADRSGKILMIGHNQRLVKAHIQAKEMIEEGVIGEVITFHTTFGHGGPETWSIAPGLASWFFDKKQAVMGAMADLGVHKTDLIQFLLGQNIVATTARLATLSKRDVNGDLIGVDDNAVCIYEMENGVMGTMTASWSYYGEEDNSTVLYGSKGIMKVCSDPGYSIVVVKSNGDRIFYALDKIQTNEIQTRSGTIDAFVECVLKNKEPGSSGRNVLAAMRAVFASLESSETGKRVEIPQNRRT